MKPVKVRLFETVRGEIPFDPNPPIAAPGVYDGIMNKLGAICVRCNDGQLLGVKPGEFSLLEICEDENDLTCNVRLLDKDAAHELADAIRSAAAPLQEFKSDFIATSNDARHGLEALVGILCGCVVIVLIVWYAHVKKLKRDHAAELGERQ